MMADQAEGKHPLHARTAILTVLHITSVAVTLGAVALVSLALDQPILVPSLAACLFLQMLLPDIPAAQPWAVVVGQLIGLGGGTLAVALLRAQHDPGFATSHPLNTYRAIAAVLAAALTLAGQRLFRAGNAAGAALAVTVALGDSSANLSGMLRGMIGIAIVAVFGEIARRLTLRTR